MNSVHFWCAVPRCPSKYRKNRTDNQKFFNFPDPDRLKVIHLQNLARGRLLKWKEAVPNCRTVTKRICSKHFVSGSPSALTDTSNVDWVPTLCLETTVGNTASRVPVPEEMAANESEAEAPTEAADVLSRRRDRGSVVAEEETDGHSSELHGYPDEVQAAVHDLKIEVFVRRTSVDLKTLQDSPKAVGKDGIGAELIKMGPDKLEICLHQLIVKIWDTEQLQEGKRGSNMPDLQEMGQMNPPVQPAMCRVCTCTDRQLIPFAQFDTDRKDYRLAEAIAAVGCVRVENNDGLPQHCCVRCLRAIESAYKIQRQCQETDRLLREMFLVKQDVPLEAVVEVKKEKEEEFEIEQLIFKEEVEEAQLQETVEVSSIKQEIEETETETVNDAARDSDECVKNEATIKEEIEESQLQLNNDEMEIDEYAQLEEQESDGDDDEELVDKAIVKSRICCGCRQYFNSSEELVAHSHEVHYRKRSKPTAKLPFQCNICYQCLPTNSEVGDHMKRFCEDRMTYPCKQCNIGFYDYKSLKIHQGLHGAERKCYMCPYVYNSSTDLRIHMQRHCPFDGMYKCLVCGAVYNSPEILKEHSLSHPTVQPFRCPHCPRVFKTRYYLTKHMDKHVKQGSAV